MAFVKCRQAPTRTLLGLLAVAVPLLGPCRTRTIRRPRNRNRRPRKSAPRKGGQQKPAPRKTGDTLLVTVLPKDPGPDSPPEIFRINSDGSGRQALLPKGPSPAIRCGPRDGKRIAFVDAAGRPGSKISPSDFS